MTMKISGILLSPQRGLVFEAQGCRAWVETLGWVFQMFTNPNGVAYSATPLGSCGVCGFTQGSLRQPWASNTRPRWGLNQRSPS